MLKDIENSIIVKNGTNAGEWLPRKTKSFYCSWNSEDWILKSIGHYILTEKPKVFLELGTFEARGTYYFASLINTYGGKLISLDANGMIHLIENEELELRPCDDPLFKEIVALRNERGKLIHEKFKNVEYEYIDAISLYALPQIFQNNSIDFVYHDSTHVYGIVRKEIQIMIDNGMKVGCAICIDDLAYEWALENMKKELIEAGFHVFTVNSNGKPKNMWLQKVK